MCGRRSGRLRLGHRRGGVEEAERSSVVSERSEHPDAADLKKKDE